MDDTNKPQTFSELIKHQRTFLHDIASPLMIALGMTEIVAAKLEQGDVEKHREKLEKAHKSLVKISDSLKSNRSLLVDLDQS